MPSFIKFSPTPQKLECLPALMYVHYVCAWYSAESEEGVGSPGTRVVDSYELPGTAYVNFLGSRFNEFPLSPYSSSSVSLEIL